MKKCKDCKSEYAERGSYCIECCAKRSKAWRENNKERFLQTKGEYSNHKKSLINQAKNKPCSDCGKSYPSYVMDFDHLNPEEKLFNVSEFNKSEEKLRKEIEKCEVVCSNCHLVRTFAKGQIKINNFKIKLKELEEKLLQRRLNRKVTEMKIP